MEYKCFVGWGLPGAMYNEGPLLSHVTTTVKLTSTRQKHSKTHNIRRG